MRYRIIPLLLGVTLTACGCVSRSEQSKAITNATTTTITERAAEQAFCKEFAPVWQDWYDRISLPEEMRSSLDDLRATYAYSLPPEENPNDVASLHNLNNKINEALDNYNSSIQDNDFEGSVFQIGRHCADYEPGIVLGDIYRGDGSGRSR